MTDDEKSLFLKNVVAVAHSDRNLTANEEAYFEDVRCAIGANKTLFKKAVDAAATHQVDLSGLSRMSFRIRNLEDMIECALADGELAAEEKTMLADLARVVGISQEQLNLILSETKGRRSRASAVCPSCGAKAGASSKFCPECGAAIDSDVQAKAVELAIPPIGVTIAICESNAAGFADALDLARKMPTFQEAVRAKKNWYAVTASKDELSPLLQIVELIGAMRNKEAYVDGQKQDWNEVFGFAWCCKRRDESYRSLEYCFGVGERQLNIWGCMQLRMDWTGWSDWFTYGKFVDEKTFQFDLDKITHEVNQQYKNVALCPYIRKRFIQEVIKQLPRRVNLGGKSPWDYRTTYDPDPRAVTVTVIRDYGGGMKEREKINAIGVEPRSPELALEIIGRAAEKAGYTDILNAELRSG